MSQLNTCKTILTALEQAMATNVGVKSVVVGDQTITFESKKDLIALIEYYERKIARLSCKGMPFSRGINLGSAW